MNAFECTIDGCGHVERATTVSVLALKIDNHLGEAHDTSLEWLMENDDVLQEEL